MDITDKTDKFPFCFTSCTFLLNIRWMADLTQERFDGQPIVPHENLKRHKCQKFCSFCVCLCLGLLTLTFKTFLS